MSTPDTLNHTYFITFPRRDLVFQLTRRGLFQQAALELAVSKGEQRGGVGHSLSRLGSLPDADLAGLVPGIIPGSRITVAKGWVWGQSPEMTQPYRLFTPDPATLCAFNGLNGRTSLQTIADQLSTTMSWEMAHAFAFSRGLFLHLVQLRLCLPQ